MTRREKEVCEIPPSHPFVHRFKHLVSFSLQSLLVPPPSGTVFIFCLFVFRGVTQPAGGRGRSRLVVTVTVRRGWAWPQSVGVGMTQMCRKLSGWLRCSLSHCRGVSSRGSIPWITTWYRFASPGRRERRGTISLVSLWHNSFI